jgi:hypothetical protein
VDLVSAGEKKGQSIEALSHAFSESSGNLQLFSELKWVVDFETARSEKLYVQLSFEAFSDGKQSVRPAPLNPQGPVIVSDGNPSLEQTATDFLTVYKKLFPKRSLADFLKVFPIGDQAMFATGFVQHQTDPKHFGVLSGNSVEGPFIDFASETRYAVYSIPENSAERMGVFEAAPKPDLYWKRLFGPNQRTELTKQLPKATQKTEEMEELRRSWSPNLNHILERFQKTGAIPSFPRFEEGSAASMHPEWVPGNWKSLPFDLLRVFYSTDPKGPHRAFVMTFSDSICATGEFGNLFILDSEKKPLSCSHEMPAWWFRTFRLGPFFAVGGDEEFDMLRSYLTPQKKYEVEVRERASTHWRGYVWPGLVNKTELSEKLRRSLARPFVERFFSDKIQSLKETATVRILGVDTEYQDSAFVGALVIEGLVAENDPKLGEISTADLVDFWRSQKQIVYPLQEIQLDRVVHFERPDRFGRPAPKRGPEEIPKIPDIP